MDPERSRSEYLYIFEPKVPEGWFFILFFLKVIKQEVKQEVVTIYDSDEEPNQNPMPPAQEAPLPAPAPQEQPAPSASKRAASCDLAAKIDEKEEDEDEDEENSSGSEYVNIKAALRNEWKIDFEFYR